MIASLVLAASVFTAASAGATDTITVFHKFAGGNDGNMPDSLILASDGNFYGTTYLGVGAVFQLTPAGQFTTIFYLPPQNPNRYFYGDYFTSVVEGPDGLLYVIANGSNSNPNPMLFRISKSGAGFQVVLQEAPDNLSVASDGNFYGADANGIFRLTTGGTYTLLFSSGTGGITPYGFGKQAADGNFYGGCSVSGVSGPPQVCRVTTSGAVTPIFQFPSGRWPANGILTQGSDGFLYGAATGTGSQTNTLQVIFQLSTSGAYRELYQSPNGCTPKTGCSRVIQASDGNLWITNPPGDAVYSITTSGTLLQTVSFSSQPNADAHPNILLQAPSGILYGTTGEPNPAYGDKGSVFSLDAGLPPPK
jgi:sugar lactone lactonase YvrE